MANDASPEVRRFRKLRIAWSVGWGILCLLTLLVWARSYRWLDCVNTANQSATPYLGSLVIDKRFVIESLSHEFDPDFLTNRVGRSSFPVNSIDITLFPNGGVTIPFWVPAMVFATVSSVPWIRSRFSLRTLLITMTLVATLLGFAVWAFRK